jgi:hypothetical protein
VLEELPRGLARPIHGQGWREEYYPRGHCRPKFVDLARFFRLAWGKQWFECSRSIPLVANLLCGHGNDLTFSVNGHDYRRFYLLADGIYPPWSIFLQPIHEPQGEKKKHYSKLQAAARKDVERAFGVLQARFDIVKNPCRLWDMGTIHNIMMGCILIHNMVVEDEMGLNLEADFDQGER